MEDAWYHVFTFIPCTYQMDLRLVSKLFKSLVEEPMGKGIDWFDKKIMAFYNENINAALETGDVKNIRKVKAYFLLMEGLGKIKLNKKYTRNNVALHWPYFFNSESFVKAAISGNRECIDYVLVETCGYLTGNAYIVQGFIKGNHIQKALYYVNTVPYCGVFTDNLTNIKLAVNIVNKELVQKLLKRNNREFYHIHEYLPDEIKDEKVTDFIIEHIIPTMTRGDCSGLSTKLIALKNIRLIEAAIKHDPPFAEQIMEETLKKEDYELLSLIKLIN